MPNKESLLHLGALALLTVLFAASKVVRAQQPAAAPEPQKTHLPSGIDRIGGTEPASQIQYLRLIVKGHRSSNALQPGNSSDPESPPLLIAQCTLRPNGKYLFDMFASFTSRVDLGYYPPWKSSGPGDLFPPRTEKVTITMDFIGYTHVKPAKKQWEIPVQTPDLYRYNSPGAASPNMEDATYYLRFLVALPTLRLTLANQTAEFVTAPWIDQIRKEPLCAASGLK